MNKGVTLFYCFNHFAQTLRIALFIILLPGVSIEFFNLAFKNLPQLSLAVINEDSNCASPIPMGCYDNQTDISCHYLAILKDKKWQWNLLDQIDPQIAQEDLRHNKINAIITIPRNFSRGLVSKVNDGKWIEEDLLDSSFIDVEVNRPDFIRSHHMEDGLLLSYQEFYRKFINACDLAESLSKIPPIKFGEPIFGNRMPEFVQFISTGIIVQISFCFPVLFSISSLVGEKLNGLMERSLIAGLTAVEVVLAHSCISLLMVFIQSLVAMLSQYWYWAHPFHGSYLLGFSLLLCEGICGTLFGLLVAVRAKSYIPGAILIFSLNGTVLLFCGYLWPIEGVPYYARPFSYLLPPTTGIQALRAIIWKSYPIYHPEVLAGFLPPLLWTVLVIINMAVYARTHHML